MGEMINRVLSIFKRKEQDEDATLDAAVVTSEQKEVNRKNKSIAIIVTIFLLLIVGYIGVTAFSIIGGRNKSADQNRKAAKVPRGAVENEIIPPETIKKDWKDTLEGRVEKLEKSTDAQTKLLTEISGKLDAKKDEPEKGRKKYPADPPPKPRVKNVDSEEGPDGGANHTRAQMQQQPVPQMQPQPTFKSFDFKPDGKQAKIEKGKDGKDKDDILLPFGFSTGITLTGADTPTFQWGQQDPQPIAASVETEMITAGDKHIDLKGCMVLASAHGAVSSERAIPRLVKMECRDKKGNLYSGKVEGWILGDDGKVGMKGRLVSKQGAIMSKAFMAGILDGVANILKAQSSVTSISPLGSTSTIDPSEAVRAGLSQGGINTAEKLQQFYIKIAEQIYPVIEVQPGRRVTVLFKGGQKLSKVTRESFDEETKVAQKETPSHTAAVRN